MANGNGAPSPVELPGVKIITPERTLITGVLQCILAGALIASLTLGVIRFLDPDLILMWYFKSATALATGTLTTWAAYKFSVTDVPAPKRGLVFFLGRLMSDRLLTSGVHHLFPLLYRVKVVYSNAQIIQYTIKTDAPSAQDNIRVIIGDKRRAVVSLRVSNPFRYFLADKAGIAIESIFLDLVRKFVNRVKFAIGMINEKNLVDDFLELPVDKNMPEHDDFRRRLDDLEVSIEDKAGNEEIQRVFDPDSVKLIMTRYAGVFRREMAILGFEVLNVLPPSIELPPDIQQAAEQKQVQHEKNRVNSMRMENMRIEAEKLQKTMSKDGHKLNSSDALDRYGLAAEQKVTRSVIGLPGIPEAIEKGAQAIINGLSRTSNPE